jgi:hypothetical protein
MTGQHTIKRFGERERERLTKFFRLLGSCNDHESEAARGRITSLLNEYIKSWDDLIELLGGNQAAITTDIRADIELFASDKPGTRLKARTNLAELLARHRKTWNDLVDELCSASPAAWVSRPSSADPERVKDLELIVHLLEDYVALQPHEYLVVALWILHTHCFDRFPVTPRLVLRSPVANCGKSTLINVMARLAANPVKFDSVTVAAIIRLIDKLRPCLLVDEADNLALALQPHGRLRSVFNSGHHESGADWLAEHGEPRKFTTFAPLALALPDMIGGLPRTLNSRSITLTMERYSGQRELRRLDVNHPDPALDVAYGQILLWRRDPQLRLNPDPEMPAGVRNRFADNWRPLLSVADSIGWGQEARAAMMVMVQKFEDADSKISLLTDIRKVFDARVADRLFSSVLLEALHELDAGDWTEFHGLRGDAQPHKLKSGELASMLRDFGIRPRPIWPLNRTPKSKSARGYRRQQFEATWRMYCSESVTPSQAKGIKSLLHVDDDTV